MKSILSNIFWTAVLWIGLFILVLMCRPLWAEDYPCEDSGFYGEVIADVPGGTQVLSDQNIYAASYSDTQFFIEFLPDYNRLIIPLPAIVYYNFVASDCSYHIEYDDVVFINGFEGE